MGLVYPELSLDLKPSLVPESITALLKQVSSISDVSDKLAKLDEFISRLQDEITKIQVFRRELPLCMLLLTDALQFLSQEATKYKTLNAYQPVLEEFIPLKRENLMMHINKPDAHDDDDDDEMKPEHQKQEMSGRDKKNWMSSVQLWTCDESASPTQSNHLNVAPSPTKVDDKVTQNGGRAAESDDVTSSKPESKVFVPMIPTFPKFNKLELEQPLAGLSLLAPGSIRHPKADSELGGTITNLPNPTPRPSPSNAHPSSRKQRRCWSPELHRRFVDALTQLGGAQVATPKQIRELMRVDGLTNDEVKSHLQKYRLHTRRVPNSSVASTNEKGSGLTVSWTTQESSKPSSSSQSGSPEGPLQFPGLTGGTSTAGDSMEDEDEDDEKSESY